MTIAELTKYRKEYRFSYRDISELTGIPISTIASRCQRLNLHPVRPISGRENWRKRPGLAKYANISPKLICYLYWDMEKSSAQVAEILHIPKRSLLGLMEHYGIKRRSGVEARRLTAKQTPSESWWKPTHEQASQNGKIGAERKRQKRASENAVNANST